MPFILAAVGSAILFGASTPLGKLLLDTLPPFQLAGLLYLGAALGMLPFSVSRSQGPFLPLRKNRLHLAGAIFFGGVLGPVLLLLGLEKASAATVALWLNLELAATAVLGYLIFKDHLGRFGWLGVAGTLAASLLLSWQEGPIGTSALALVTAACICWALDNHLTALIDTITPPQSTCVKGMVAGSLNLAISYFTEPFGTEIPAILSALLLGAFAYGFSISLYITAAQNLGATRSQMIFASAPFFGVALSALVLGESISPLQMMAALILVAALFTLFLDRHSHAHTHTPLTHKHWHHHGDGHHLHGHPDPEPGGKPENFHGHWHQHPQTSHAHPHWPDIHHRATHGSDHQTDPPDTQGEK